MHTWQCGKNEIIDYWRYPAYGLAAIPLIAFIVIMAVNGGVPLGGEAWKEANWGEADCTVETKAGAGSSFFGPGEDLPCAKQPPCTAPCTATSPRSATHSDKVQVFCVVRTI